MCDCMGFNNKEEKFCPLYLLTLEHFVSLYFYHLPGHSYFSFGKWEPQQPPEDLVAHSQGWAQALQTPRTCSLSPPVLSSCHPAVTLMALLKLTPDFLGPTNDCVGNKPFRLLMRV